MTAPGVVFLLDVDNTLLDNDKVGADLDAFVKRTIGVEGARRYWASFEALRSEKGYADYLGAVRHMRNAQCAWQADDRRFLGIQDFLCAYPYGDALYPRALEAIAHLREFGHTVLLSDGETDFQPRKVRRSGLWDAVDGRVLVYVHKERMLHDVQRHYPARHYVMVEDKLRILRAMKLAMGARLTTVFVRQGHYALDPANLSAYGSADMTVACIGELADATALTWPFLLDATVMASA